MLVDSEKHPHQASISVPPHDAQQQHKPFHEGWDGFFLPKMNPAQRHKRSPRKTRLKQPSKQPNKKVV